MFSAEADALTTWLADAVDPSVTSVELEKMAGGHSSGAWRLEVRSDAGTVPMVLKAPELPSVVHRRDAGREGRILDALGRMGAPVPAIVAIDDGTRALGRPCFVMEHVEGRALADTSPGSYHDDPWLREAGADVQRAVWDSFHDALAAVHAVDGAKVPDASLGPGGVVDVLAYWREALLEAAPAETVPRQLAVLDWLGEHVPPGADDSPAVCMGDARMVNCLIEGTDVRVVFDFEVAYLGNPAADIGYSLFVDDQQRGSTEALPGFPSPEETWARWSRATGRPVEHPAYWTAFGATIIAVTATRAMIQWGLSGPSIESDNPLVGAWERAVERAR
jgi:aminoglycoside phosphotransferase (APT) family kinase protein